MAAAAPGAQPGLTEAALLAWLARPVAGATFCEAVEPVVDPVVAPEFDAPVLPFAPLAEDPLVVPPAAPAVALPLVALELLPTPAVKAPPVEAVPPAPAALPATPPGVLVGVIVAVPGCDVLPVPVTPGFALDPVPGADEAAVPLELPILDPGAAAPLVPPCPAAPDAAPVDPAAPPAAPPSAPAPPPAPAAKQVALVTIRAAAVKIPTRPRNIGGDMSDIEHSTSDYGRQRCLRRRRSKDMAVESHDGQSEKIRAEYSAKFVVNW